MRIRRFYSPEGISLENGCIREAESHSNSSEISLRMMKIKVIMIMMIIKMMVMMMIIIMIMMKVASCDDYYQYYKADSNNTINGF